MTRLIDADALCEEFKKRQRAALRWKEKAILDGDEERSIRADATLAFLSEVKLTIDNAPTIPLPDFKEGYKQAILDGKTNFSRTKGEWIRQSESRTIFFCSNCGREINTSPFTRTDNFPYCHCGSDNREDEK